MEIAFYVDEMNLRGVANSTFHYAFYNEKILKNKSIIFFNQKNHRNRKKVILKFKNKFKVIGVNCFKDIDLYKEKLKLNFIYTQKGGKKDEWISSQIKTLVHYLYPQKLSQIHGYRYVCVSEWLSKKFSNNKIQFLPYIVETKKTTSNLRKKLKIKKSDLVFGCHGGESSFDLNFTHDAIKEILNKRKDIIFVFLNINKFFSHPQIKFLKGSVDENYKKKFLNTCDAMIYGRSLGETFGLACGEFAILGKKIISYKFNRHRSHINSLPNQMYEEYSSKNNLIKILENFKRKNYIRFKKDKNKYLDAKPQVVMRKFKKVFLSSNYFLKPTLIDKLRNYFSFIIMGYFYTRHKIYQIYYRFFESKIYF
jgi:hypothetical protein